ncbi:MAG: hypothetical protein LIO55_00150 [Oscillospiraceae bacterium]|nr:hypothetical protein [Oscillospiraceae bacterium]MCC8089819.1 hypothetical protein [Oscillospiraceae bacterium]
MCAITRGLFPAIRTRSSWTAPAPAAA